MESEINRSGFASSCGALLLTAVVASFAPRSVVAEDAGTGEISLQKTAAIREYNGKPVEGQERVVHPGDTLWRILIQEKGFEEKRFGLYMSLVRRLNPDMKTADALRVGQKVFIPLRPDEALDPSAAAAAAKAPIPAQQPAPTREYTVKGGDFLARILREQLGLSDDKKLALYFNLTKDLNPQRKNWDLLQAGDVIRLPAIE